MTTGYETLDVVDRWLVATLTPVVPSGTELIVEQTTEPVSADPYVLISLVSSRDILGVGTTRIDTDNIYMIKAVNRTNLLTPGRATMRLIDAALHGKIETTAYGSISCVRETQQRYAEAIDGVQFMHVGATYRIRATSS